MGCPAARVKINQTINKLNLQVWLAIANGVIEI